MTLSMTTHLSLPRRRRRRLPCVRPHYNRPYPGIACLLLLARSISPTSARIHPLTTHPINPTNQSQHLAQAMFTYQHRRSLPPIHNLAALLLLLLLLPLSPLISAQHNAPLNPASVPPIDPASAASSTAAAPSLVSLLPAALTSAANPFGDPYSPAFTDPASAPSMSPDSSAGDTTDHSPVVNYYFLLLAIFVVVFILLYWFLLRSRRRRIARASRGGQNALVADLGRWPGSGDGRDGYGGAGGPMRRWLPASGSAGARGADGGNAPHATTRTGRWFVLRSTRPQEGLDERGEAPPAYVAKPGPAHAAAGSMTPEWVEMQHGKPPDYQEMSRS